MINSCCSPDPGLNQLISLSVPVKLKDYRSAIMNFERALEKAKLVPSEAAQNGIIAVRGLLRGGGALGSICEELLSQLDTPASNAIEMQWKCSFTVGKDLIMIAESKRKQGNVGYVAAFLGLSLRTTSLSGLG